MDTATDTPIAAAVPRFTAPLAPAVRLPTAEISAAALAAAAPAAVASEAAVPARASVRERLKAQKAEAGTVLTTTLPVSGLSATYPGFLGHAQVIAATQLAGKERNKVAPILVAQVCLFEGERLTVDEINGELLHNSDAVHLIDLVLGKGGKGEAGDASGN